MEIEAPNPSSNKLLEKITEIFQDRFQSSPIEAFTGILGRKIVDFLFQVLETKTTKLGNLLDYYVLYQKDAISFLQQLSGANEKREQIISKVYEIISKALYDAIDVIGNEVLGQKKAYTEILEIEEKLINQLVNLMKQIAQKKGNTQDSQKFYTDLVVKSLELSIQFCKEFKKVPKEILPKIGGGILSLLSSSFSFLKSQLSPEEEYLEKNAINLLMLKQNARETSQLLKIFKEFCSCLPRHIENESCTFLMTKKNYKEQHMYNCETCQYVESKGVCTICAFKCHNSHELRYSKYVNFYCDCGGEEPLKSKCTCIRPPKIGSKRTKASLFKAILRREAMLNQGEYDMDKIRDEDDLSISEFNDMMDNDDDDNNQNEEEEEYLEKNHLAFMGVHPENIEEIEKILRQRRRIENPLNFEKIFLKASGRKEEMEEEEKPQVDPGIQKQESLSIDVSELREEELSQDNLLSSCEEASIGLKRTDLEKPSINLLGEGVIFEKISKHLLQLSNKSLVEHICAFSLAILDIINEKPTKIDASAGKNEKMLIEQTKVIDFSLKILDPTQLKNNFMPIFSLYKMQVLSLSTGYNLQPMPFLSSNPPDGVGCARKLIDSNSLGLVAVVALNQICFISKDKLLKKPAELPQNLHGKHFQNFSAIGQIFIPYINEPRHDMRPESKAIAQEPGEIEFALKIPNFNVNSINFSKGNPSLLLIAGANEIHIAVLENQNAILRRVFFSDREMISKVQWIPNSDVISFCYY